MATLTLNNISKTKQIIDFKVSAFNNHEIRYVGRECEVKVKQSSSLNELDNDKLTATLSRLLAEMPKNVEEIVEVENNNYKVKLYEYSYYSTFRFFNSGDSSYIGSSWENLNKVKSVAKEIREYVNLIESELLPLFR